MTECIEAALKSINEGSASCIVIKEDKIISTEQARGIKPIVFAYENGLLDGATVVDKVVGRAAAMIMALGGVKACYALTASKGALDVFGEYGIYVEYSTVAEYIVNRAGNGMCPMEEAVKGIDSPSAAILAIRKKQKELSKLF